MSYEDDIIVPDSLRATAHGFEIDLRLAYYRALGLTMLEDIRVSIDGEPVRREDIRLRTPSGSHRLDELVSLDEERWPFTESRTMVIGRPLMPGEHVFTVTEQLRISYIGSGLIASCTRTLTA